MRRFAPYLMAAILLAVAVGLIAPLGGLGLPVGARAAVEPGAIVQSVNRDRKGDRLSVPAASGKRQLPRRGPVIMVGCEPVFSPLSTAFARANFARRCAV